MAPAANHGWYKLFFYWLHETAACCCFGVDLGNGLDQYSLSRLAVRGRDSLLLSQLALLYCFSPFLIGQIILGTTPFLTLPFGQKISKSNSSSVFSSDKNILSPTPILQTLSQLEIHSNLAKIF